MSKKKGKGKGKKEKGKKEKGKKEKGKRKKEKGSEKNHGPQIDMAILIRGKERCWNNEEKVQDLKE